MINFVIPFFFGAVLSDQNRDFSDGANYIRSSGDVITKFEALLTLSNALNEVNSDEDFRNYQTSINHQISETGNFIVNDMIQHVPSHSDRAFVYRFYNSQWARLSEGTDPTNSTNYPTVSPGNGLRLAYMLSRAVEQGFDSSWLTAANELLNFFLNNGMFNAKTGFINGLTSRDNGTVIDGGLYSWIYAEACRTLLHFYVLRDCKECLAHYESIHTNVVSKFLVDTNYNGWYDKVDPVTHLPLYTEKANIEKSLSPEIGFYSEAVRLSDVLTTSPATHVSYTFRNWAISLAVIFSSLFIVVGIRQWCKNRAKNQTHELVRSSSGGTLDDPSFGDSHVDGSKNDFL